MATDELQQALERQKIANSETDYIEMVARLLDVPIGMIHRLMYIMVQTDMALGDAGRPSVFAPIVGRSFDEHQFNVWLPDLEVRAAYRETVWRGINRVILARAILDNQVLHAATESILPREKIADLCFGCPEQLECIAGKLSTPEKCYTGDKAILSLRPLRMGRGEVEVELTQPQGKRSLPIAKLKFVKPRAV